TPMLRGSIPPRSRSWSGWRENSIRTGRSTRWSTTFSTFPTSRRGSFRWAARSWRCFTPGRPRNPGASDMARGDFNISSRINPGEFFQLYTGVPVPDPITFVVSPDYLNQPNLYPRQATLLKLIFLRDDLLTTYDHEVIEDLTRKYKHTGNNGLQPDILDRIRVLKAEGRKWFREVLLVMGRRAG